MSSSSENDESSSSETSSDSSDTSFSEVESDSDPISSSESSDSDESSDSTTDSTTDSDEASTSTQPNRTKRPAKAAPASKVTRTQQQTQPSTTTGSSQTYTDADTGGPSAADQKFTPSTIPGPQLPAFRRNRMMYTKAIDYFKLFFTVELISKICHYTNLYAKDKLTPSYKSVSHELQPEEFYRYIGLIVYMGIVRLNRMHLYWSKNPLYNLALPRKVMPFRRFKFIMAYLHVAHPKKEKKSEGRLRKVSFVLSHFKKMCQTLYKPSQKMSVDERMVKSKNRSGIRQFIKNKPVRFGIKLWVLAEAKSGYTYDFEVYTGKSENKTRIVREKGKGLGYEVVTKLCQTLKNQGYHVYFDNFFTSGPLLQDLKDDFKILACGTTMKNRAGYPDQFKKSDKQWAKSAKRGDMRWIRDGDKVILQWRDNRIITMVTTIHKGHMSDTCKRRVKNKEGKWEQMDVKRPLAVRDYNQYMGGVDLSDQLISKYNCLQKVERWWKTLFFHMVDIAIVNSYILFNRVRNKYKDKGLKRNATFDQLAFRQELVSQLTAYADEEEEDDNKKVSKKVENKNQRQQRLHVVQSEAKPGNCTLCWHMNKVEKKVRTSCTVCQKNFCTLWDRNCFEKAHSAVYEKVLANILSSGLRGKKKDK